MSGRNSRWLPVQLTEGGLDDSQARQTELNKRQNRLSGFGRPLYPKPRRDIPRRPNLSGLGRPLYPLKMKSGWEGAGARRPIQGWEASLIERGPIGKGQGPGLGVHNAGYVRPVCLLLSHETLQFGFVVDDDIPAHVDCHLR